MIGQILNDGQRGEIVNLVATLAYWRVIATRAKYPRTNVLRPVAADLLTAKQAADDLKINTETVRVLCRRGELSCIRIGRSLRITRSALERFKLSRQVS